MPGKAVLCHVGGNGSAKAYSTDSTVHNADTSHLVSHSHNRTLSVIPD